MKSNKDKISSTEEQMKSNVVDMKPTVYDTPTMQDADTITV